MAVQWRVARSLDVLLGQLNTVAPRRNKASDGSIGDTDHQNRSSDHNPWYGPGIVTARDFTHDPAGGLDCGALANTLVAHRDPRIKYIIWNRRILSGSPGPSPWVWRAYSGANPHTNHLHLSVVASPACDSTAAWAGISSPEDDMDQNETLRRDWDGKEATVKTVLLESWQNSYDILALVRSFPALLEAATRNPDLTRDEIAKIVRENAQPFSLEQVKQVVRDAAAEDNVELADEIVDRIAQRMVN